MKRQTDGEREMPKPSGREREAYLIRQANRAAAVGKLMLGELKTWQQFLEADRADLVGLPRRTLRAGRTDVKRRVSPEIKKFCSANFQNIDERKLSLLYETIKAHRGLEMPLPEFEAKFATVRRPVLRGSPTHATVHISLWGLKFWFPEDELAKDLITALQLISETSMGLRTYRAKPHFELEKQQSEIASLMRKQLFAARSILLCCFNLIEAYLNGLAWDYVQTHKTSSLSNRKRKLLEDTASASVRDKLEKYPEIITGRRLWGEPGDEELSGFVSTLKPYRDSLVHPSPFSAPDRFGGYDKLRLFHQVDSDIAVKTAELLVRIIQRIQRHIFQDDGTIPAWVRDLESEVKNVSEQLS